MAIDPRLYEKLSGRSGDPRDRLGQVLASDAKTKQSRAAAGDKSTSQRLIEGHFKTKMWMSIIGSVIVLLVLFSALWR